VTNALIGDSTNRNFLETLGIPDYDACVVAIGDGFQGSLETVSLLKELGARHIIARASSDQQEKLLLKIGSDEVIYPERKLAFWVAIRCSSVNILDYRELDDEYAVIEVTPPEEWAGKTLLALELRRRYDFNVLGLRTNGKLDCNVEPNTVFRRDQSVLLLGSRRKIRRCFQL
jgi:trk system potassium uptake protein TrkA